MTGLRIRALMLGLAAGAALALGGCGEGGSAGDPAAQEKPVQKVTFNMSWLPQGSMAGVIMASEKGYYRDAGLEVEAVRGFGGVRTANELDQGMFEFGYSDPLAVILNRSKGGKTRMVGSINSRWPSGMCFVRERHDVKTPADLKGLTLGGGQNSPMQVLVPAWLKRNGIDPAAVKIMQLDPSVVVASLIEGKIDAGECWLGNSMALFEKRAREAGVTLGWIAYADYNLDIYGNGLVTTDKLIAEKPELVRSFVAATYKGYEYAIAHPDEAVAVMVKRYPVLDPAITRQQLMETAALMKGEARMGWLDKAKVQETLTFIETAYGLKDAIAVDDVYTTEFVPAAAPAAGQ